MAADAFGIEVPADSDAFDPSGDMRDMGASLHVRTVAPVVNATARDALVVVAGQLVNRLDTGNLERWDGAAWQVLAVGDTGWVPLTPAGGVRLELNPAVRRIGNTVSYRGLARNGTTESSVFDSGDTGIAQSIANVFMPDQDVRFWAPSFGSAGSARMVLGSVYAAEGVIRVTQGNSTSSRLVYLDTLTYFVD